MGVTPKEEWRRARQWQQARTQQQGTRGSPHLKLAHDDFGCHKGEECLQ